MDRADRKQRPAGDADLEGRAPSDPWDPLDQPERRLVVDAYDSVVRGPGAHSPVDQGPAAPGTGWPAADPLDGQPDGEPGSP